MTARNVRFATAVALVGLLLAGAAFVVRTTYFAPTTITAYFVSATGIYSGDEVRIAGVKVGTISDVEPVGGQARMTFHVDRDVPVPVDAKAVIVAQSLVAARYVQLTPPYETTGPTMADGAVIPVERTAIPVEWDEVKAQLTRLATDLGPRSGVSGTSLSRFIDSAANAMDGNGEKLRRTLAELSGLGRILADGSGNLVDVIKNLQTFVSALRDSNQQIVEFQGRFATLTSVVNDESDLGSALTDLSSAVGDVRRFVAGSRDQTAEQLQRLTNVTQNLVDHRMDLENLLHAAPNALANAYDIYDPDSGSQIGRFALNNFSNPMALLCNAITAVASVTSAETAKLCSQTLGPLLNSVSLNELPFPVSPLLMKSMNPDRLIYSEPDLAPGGAGPKPVAPEIPPAVSAYTGRDGDQAPPPGFGQPPAVAPGPSAPDHLPAAPSPAVYPGAPVPGPPSLPALLLPAEAPPS
ncbi:MAG: phospholipid/cholesterol/gamma-HCH transport system substrate-binding protein [Mycobacterium sp.]|jgi:virulence factor Mce-like protein|nr:phospholipid/cholesterol/gamma-HCH transport system substrate-binding protein [Mycobacterium sp.]